jgi:hypothetical protein
MQQQGEQQQTDSWSASWFQLLLVEAKAQCITTESQQALLW